MGKKAWGESTRLSRTSADGKYISYNYYPNGMLKTFTNARLQTTTYGYDANNNLQSISYSSGAPAVNFGNYDAYNRPTTRTDGVGTFTYTFDANNRLTDIKYPWDNGNVTVHYGYNALGQLDTLTPLNGTPVSYTYDPIGRLETIKRGTDTNPFRYTYEQNTANPLVQRLSRPNGSYTVYEYNDQLKRLTAILNWKSNDELISKYEYTYNNLDLKDTETITGGLPLDNLVDGTTGYTPNDVNQLVSTQHPNRTYTYDNDGNMITGFTPEGYPLTMTYDAENRLTSAQFTDGAGKVQKTTYDYTADNLLAVMKKFENSALTSTTRFVRAGFLPIQERDANNAVTREYLWGLNMGGGIGGLLNLKQGGLDYNYLYDGKGNVTSLINTAQATVAQYAYDPFGNVKKTGTLDQPFQFSTKQYDPQTGLSYYGYRFYSPQLGRWINRDPIGEAGGVNLYQAVGNNAVNLIDPEGLFVPPSLQGRYKCEPKCKKTLTECLDKCVSTLNPWWTTPVGSGFGAAATYGTGGSSVAGAGAALAGWGLGSSAGCVLVCSQNACYYDGL